MDPYKPLHRTLRNTFREVGANEIDRKTRNELMVEEQMSKLFTKKRRIEALSDFEMRLEMTLQKKKLKKKALEKKYYDFDFKPRTNKKRINIYSKTLPSSVVATLKKKKRESKHQKISKEKNLNQTIRKKIAPRKSRKAKKSKQAKKVSEVKNEIIQNTTDDLGNDEENKQNQGNIFKDDNDQSFEKESNAVELVNQEISPMKMENEEEEVQLEVVTVKHKLV